MAKTKDTSLLERVKLLREQWEEKAVKIEENELELSLLSEELRDGNLTMLKRGGEFKERAGLVERMDRLRDEIAEAKRDLPLLKEAIHELGEESIPEVIDAFEAWCAEHHGKITPLAQEVVDHWLTLRDAIRSLRKHREEYEAKRAEVSAELKTFGCRNPVYPRSTFYPASRGSVAVALKSALAVTFSAPLDHRSAQAGVLRVEDLLKKEESMGFGGRR